MPISIAQSYESVEVDLWGELHKTRPVTRSVEKAIEKVQEKFDATDDLDRQVGCLAELIGLRLEKGATATGLRAIVTAVERKWKSDELTMAQVWAFVEKVGEADRPT